jgi:hypothetical protein
MPEERTGVRSDSGTNGIQTEERIPAPVVRRVEEVRERTLPDGFDLRSDRVHWGPIVAGLLTALTALLLLNLLGLAIGLTTINAGTAAAQGGPPADAGRTRLSGLESAVSCHSCSAATSQAVRQRCSTEIGAR